MPLASLRLESLAYTPNMFLLSLFLLVGQSLGQNCILEGGLPCGSSNVLTPGSSYTIESKVCSDGKYPKRENCIWSFEVKDCKPTLRCEKMDLQGGTGEKCPGNRLRFESANRRKAFCRQDQITNGFTDNQRTSFVDIYFKSNNNPQGSGFKCTVSCSTTPPVGKCDCGGVNRPNRIVGGTETAKNEYPWQVGLVSAAGQKPFCGGSIISAKTVLTAAHCIEDLSSANQVKVTVAEHDITDNSDGQETVDVCSIISHPNYDSPTVDNDFALLILCNPLKFRREVSSVCLPEQEGSVYDKVTTTVTGWGSLSTDGQQADKLMGVNVNTLGNAKCNDKYDGLIEDSMICATAPGKSACQADSGGPMTTREAGNFYSIIGVVSWGLGCASPDYPGVYSRVTKAKDWIVKNMKGRRCFPPNKNRYDRIQTRQFQG